MQNLTLQMAQLPKNAADTSNFTADKSAEAPGLSFQTLLKQQVKTHQGQHKSAQKISSEKVSNERSAEMQEKDATVLQDGIDLLAKEDTPLAIETNQNGDTPTDGAINNAVDTNLLGLNIPVAAPVLWSSVTIAKTLPSTPDGTLDAQTNSVIGEMLNNAMSQDKGLQSADSVASDSKIVQPISDNKLATEQTRWLDISPQDTAKLNTTAEALSVKMKLEVAGDKTKALDNKASDIKVADIKNQELSANLVNVSLQSPQNMAPRAVEQLASSNNIYAYPGKTGWDQAISQKVVWMVSAGEQSATLNLNPPDLGPLQVVISVNNDKADTTFISNNAEVRQALQDGMANLREKMSESGLQLGQANISSGNQNQQAYQPASKHPSASQGDSKIPLAVEEKMNRTLLRVSNGLVDTFV